MTDTVAIKYSNIPLGVDDSLDLMAKVVSFMVKELTRFCGPNQAIEVSNNLCGPHRVISKTTKIKGKWFKKRQALIKIHDALASSGNDNYWRYAFIEIHDKSIEDIVSKALAIYFRRFTGVSLPSFYRMYEEGEKTKLEPIEINYSNASVTERPLYDGGLKIGS